MIGCEGKITYVERFAGWSAWCPCGWTESEPNRAKIRKAAITHKYGTAKQRRDSVEG
jgi:hypothetical protein